jgi:hypothetical protein
MLAVRRFALTIIVSASVVGHASPPNATAGQTASAPTNGCDHACLTAAMAEFLKAMTTGRSAGVPLAADAEIRENGAVIALSAATWKDVKAIRSVITFADAMSANVLSRAGVELAEGKPGYISTRLKLGPSGRIVDIEMSADTGPSVAAEYVWKLDPQLEAVLPAEQRLSRAALEALARRYFQSLSSHTAAAADFDGRCNRFHSGRQITNAADNAVEGGPARTCAGSLEGTPPWGPATEHRLPIIDVERGIVVGMTLLHYPKLPHEPRMYVSEVFKVVSGRIVTIDNIGLMRPGLATLGFVH